MITVVVDDDNDDAILSDDDGASMPGHVALAAPGDTAPASPGFSALTVPGDDAPLSAIISTSKEVRLKSSSRCCNGTTGPQMR